MKICSRCKTEKSVSEFHKDKNKKDGLNNICKMCAIEKGKKYRQANPEKVRDGVNRWRQANPEKVRESIKRWQQANPEKKRESNKIYYAINKQSGL